MTPPAFKRAVAPERSERRFRRAPLAMKLAIAFVGLVAFVLIVNGAIDTYLTYNQAKRAALEVEAEKARAAAERVGVFLDEILTELGWTAGVEWGYAKPEQQRYDFIRLLRLTPAITALSYIDGHGKEQLEVSRLAPDTIASGKDFSTDPRFVRAVADKVWFGPVEFRRGSEPYMTVALAHVGKTPGVTVADVNLKLIWDVISAIHVGDKGFAYVVDRKGRLIAHPDLSLVLRDTDLSALPQVAAALAGKGASQAEVARALDGASVLTAHAVVPRTHWTVFVEQPLAEALATAYRSLLRSLALLGFGLTLAAVSGVALARRMAAPIRLLQAGAEKLGSGDLAQRLDIRTGDEIEALAGGFNRMAERLQESYETLEAKVEERTKDLNEALQQQTATAEILKVIASSPSDVQPVFDAIARSAAELCEGKNGAVFVLRDGRIHLVGSHGLSPQQLATAPQTYPAPVDRGMIAGRAILDRAVTHIPDIAADPEYTAAAIVRAGLRSAISVPMLRHGEPIGAVNVTREEPRAFSAAQIELLKTFADQAVIAIENARLFSETKEALERQTATAEILRVIASSPTDVQPVFEAIATNANRLLRGHSTTVTRYMEAKSHIAAFTPVSPEADAALVASYPRPLRGNAAYEAVRDGGTFQLADVEATDPDGMRNQARLRGWRSVTAVPLSNRGAVIGSIAVTRATPGALSDDDIQLLQTFADQTVIAIENARLFEEVRARTRDTEESLAQQTATAEVLKVISRSVFDLNSVLQTLIDTAVRLTHGNRGTIFLKQDDVLVARAFHSNVPDQLRAYLTSTPWRLDGDSHMARAVRERAVVHIADLSKSEIESDQEVQKRASFGAGLWTPLMRKGEVIGVFGVPRDEPIGFTPREIELVQTFADQAVIAIENARLFAEVQARTGELEESLAQQTATAEVLKVISRSAFDLDAIFQTLVATAVELCAASSGTLCVRDGDIFRYRGMAGPEASPTLQQYLAAHPLMAPDRGTVAGRAILSRQTEEIADVLAEADYAVPFAASGSSARSLLGVPLLGKTEVLGAIVVTRPEPGSFSRRHVEILRTFADQAVIAIENTRLFDEVQSRTRELEQSLSDLRKAQDRLVQSEKLASLGQLTAGIAHEIKNPLNFVNNFASLSRELLEELRETLQRLPDDAKTDADDLMRMINSNLEKVASHGRRANSIVKNMLLHSREGSGERSRVNVNAMVEEALNLGYHGARAEKPGFNVNLEKDFDPEAGAADIYLQEVTRVLLNLISNGFYATDKRRQAEGPGYEPTLKVSTRGLGHNVEIRIRDNGTGIPEEVRAKMFNPFFTTKPAGEGTGLGLSLSHDIVVKQHGGTLDVETAPGAFTEFVIILPREGAGA